MRLLDRYLLRELLVPLGACLGGFLIFWTAFNLLGELGEFQQHHLTAGDVAAYVWAGLPEQLNTILPVGLLLALLYTLTHLSKHHELTAMRAAGCSLWRLMLPYLLLGTLASAGLYVLNEHLAPDGKERQERLLLSRDRPDEVNRQQWRERLNFQSPQRHWSIGAFNLRTAELRNPRVRQWLPRDTPWEFTAARLRWTNGAWRASNVTEILGRNATDRDPLRRRASSTEFPSLPARPDDVLRWPHDPWLVPHSFTVAITNAAGLRTNLTVVTNLAWRTNLIVPALTNEAGTLWHAAGYDPVSQDLLGVRAQVPLAPGAIRITYSDSGRWESGRWVFEKVTDVLYRSPTDFYPLTTAEPLPQLALPELEENPEMLRSEIRIGQLNQKKALKGPNLSVAEIRNYRRLHPQVPTALGAWLDTQLQARLAAPWTCLVVVLIAIPFGVTTGRRNVFYGVAGSLGLAFGFFVLQRVGFALGQSGQLSAVLAAWLPNILFAILGIALTTRIR